MAGRVLLLAALLAANVVLAADVRTLDAARIESFLKQLEGRWQGQAVITPIGPRPYDITFARTAAGDLEGAAEPGAAVHTWTFHQEGENLRLRFLSNFRGNRQPILLNASGEADGVVIFRAQKPSFLAVNIGMESGAPLIRVYHGDRLHVEIRLWRR